LAIDKRLLHIVIGAATDRNDHDATIWMFRLLPQATVSIGDGENSGRTITYRNVAREIRAIGIWKGHLVALDLPRAEVDPGRDEIAVILQEGGYGRIIGAATLERLTQSDMR
jgi:hypothetical protein